MRLVSVRTSWVAIEPTPPAPPMMRTAGAAPATGLRISMRSNKASHAVIACTVARPHLSPKSPTLVSPVTGAV